MAIYYLRYRDRVSRPKVFADITRDAINALRSQKLLEDNHVDPDPMLPLKKDGSDAKMVDFIRDDFPTYISQFRGMHSRVPLSYIIRDDETPSAHSDVPATNYMTKDDELVARMPHTHAQYGFDNATVWEHLKRILKLHGSYQWIKSHDRDRDGRAAFATLTTRYLGNAASDSILYKANYTL